MNVSRLTRQMARIALVGATCVALYGLPAQGSVISISVDFSNWFQGHGTYGQHCYSQPQNRHWGRAAQYNLAGAIRIVASATTNRISSGSRLIHGTTDASKTTNSQS